MEVSPEELRSQALALERNFSQPRTGLQDVDALLSLVKWDTLNLTFRFPDDASDYPSPYNGRSPPNREPDIAFAEAPPAVQTAFRAAAGQLTDVTRLTLSEVTDSTPDIAVAISGAEQLFAGKPAYAYYPGPNPHNGDVWLAARDPRMPSNPNPALQPTRGNFGWFVALHELSHAVGLKHPGEPEGPSFTIRLFPPSPFLPDTSFTITLGNPVVARPERDSLEFSVVSQRSYVGATPDVYRNEPFGYPQTLMMDDIRALQEMYGANFETRSDNTTYQFNPTTGEVTINAVAQGAPGANKLFLTIWDGGGTDTYDFSAYSSNLSIDLSPGGWSITSPEQRAHLGDGELARGNVFNALQFRDDPRSLIENAIGGSGSDVMLGNTADNEMSGGLLGDWIVGRAGTDTLIGDVTDLNTAGAHDSLFGGGDEDILNGDANFMRQFATGGFDFLDGGDDGDNLRGDASGMFDFARGGGDTLSGGGGDDLLFGDALIMRDNTTGGDDSLFGGDGNDSLFGDAVVLSNNAQGGDDRLNGGAGDDVLTGDAIQLLDSARGARDSFVFTDGFGNDTIQDFRQGEDLLEFQVTGINGFGDLEIARVGNDTVITAGSSGTVRLAQFNLGLTAADVII
jgi:serralysin